MRAATVQLELRVAVAVAGQQQKDKIIPEVKRAGMAVMESRLILLYLFWQRRALMLAGRIG
jgi:hypothetical protein